MTRLDLQWIKKKFKDFSYCKIVPKTKLSVEVAQWDKYHRNPHREATEPMFSSNNTNLSSTHWNLNISNHLRHHKWWNTMCWLGLYIMIWFMAHMCNVPIFSKFLQLARSVHHRNPHELTIRFQGLSCVVIGFPAAYGMFWLRLRDLIFILSQSVGSDELNWVRGVGGCSQFLFQAFGLGSKNLGGSVYL